MQSPDVLVEAGTVLHIGFGGHSLPYWIKAGKETTLDVEPRLNPDIVADMKDMGEIGQFDVVYCSHALEHLNLHEGIKALGEIKRVLKDGGMAYIMVPDIEDVRPTDEVVYESDAGPVTGLDILYGFQAALKDYPSMAHRFGYTATTLERAMKAAGFDNVKTSRKDGFNVVGVGIK